LLQARQDVTTSVVCIVVLLYTQTSLKERNIELANNLRIHDHEALQKLKSPGLTRKYFINDSLNIIVSGKTGIIASILSLQNIYN